MQNLDSIFRDIFAAHGMTPAGTQLAERNHRALDAIVRGEREHMNRAPRSASVLDHGKHFSVFDADEHLVAQVWVKDASEGAKDRARRLAHEIREKLDNGGAELAPQSLKLAAE